MLSCTIIEYKFVDMTGFTQVIPNVYKDLLFAA